MLHVGGISSQRLQRAAVALAASSGRGDQGTPQLFTDWLEGSAPLPPTRAPNAELYAAVGPDDQFDVSKLQGGSKAARRCHQPGRRTPSSTPPSGRTTNLTLANCRATFSTVAGHVDIPDAEDDNHIAFTVRADLTPSLCHADLGC